MMLPEESVSASMRARSPEDMEIVAGDEAAEADDARDPEGLRCSLMTDAGAEGMTGMGGRGRIAELKLRDFKISSRTGFKFSAKR